MKKTFAFRALFLGLLATALFIAFSACGSNQGAVKPDSVAAETYLNSGNAYYNKADFDLAIADYTHAIALNPNLTEAYNNRGYVYYIKGDKELAIMDFEAALKLDPDYTSAKNNLERAKK